MTWPRAVKNRIVLHGWYYPVGRKYTKLMGKATKYAVLPDGRVLGITVRMRDGSWVFTYSTGGSRNGPSDEKSVPMSVWSRGAKLYEANSEIEASFKARQLALFPPGLAEGAREAQARRAREREQDDH